ncbi:MAG TPA: PilT/PilU family type 4a pilus ATPase [Candidatus Caccocola faecipullorum]|nr:PilT/PilU family type 4a pilus ATPase [Candidatus Caccocola faecipullorum]
MEKSIFSEILDKALKNSASDVHIGVGEHPLMRVDGFLRAAGERPFTEKDFELALGELGCRDAETFVKERELDFGSEITVNGEKTRLRVNLSYSLGRPAAAIRVIAPRVRSIDELGLPPVLKELAAGRSGLFLVTGPSGSGKSTTLAAMIEEINTRRAVHIVTVEDPVEYIFEPKRALIHQREAGRDTSGFAEALRRAMRQDPDVIMIGELRDAETVGAAISAAETGHLVLSTLHTGGAAAGADRIAGFFPPSGQPQIRARLAQILTGVMSQRLARRAGGGRAAAAELLIATNAVRSCIREGKSAQLADIMRSGAQLGMTTLEQSLARLCAEGAVDFEEALSLAPSPEELRSCLAAL